MDKDVSAGITVMFSGFLGIIFAMIEQQLYNQGTVIDEFVTGTVTIADIMALTIVIWLDRRIHSRVETLSKQFTPETWRRKEEEDKDKAKALNERENYERQINQKIKIIFVNIGLGRQSTARNFWVSIPEELPIQEIDARVQKAFGDLK